MAVEEVRRGQSEDGICINLTYMYTNIFLHHKDADTAFLDRVIALKQKAWPYPKESQLAWMASNLKDDDIHVMLMNDDHDVAYLNLCDVRCNINGTDTQCVGIGNVCSTQIGGVRRCYRS